MMGPRVLVVDDEPRMVELIGLALESQGLTWSGAADADEAMEALLNQRFDLLVLDVMLPGESGLDFCRRIRTVSELPIVLVSALGTTEERIAGLEAGADDYISKPFSPRELALRVHALLRREKLHRESSGDTLQRSIGEISLDARRLRLTVRGQPVHLSAGEFKMLWLLSEHLGQTVGWRELFQAMTNGDVGGYGAQQAVRTAIYRLRAKLGDSPNAPRHLFTDHGRGYRLVSGLE